MASLANLLHLIFLIYFVGHSSIHVAPQGLVSINGAASIAETDDDFVCATLDWWPPEKCDYGTCSWGKASLLNLDLHNPILLNAIKAFSPLKIRLGGTLQDKVTYQTYGSQQPCPPFVKSSEIFGFSQGCLPRARWDQLNGFFEQAGAAVIFGLNALSGRTVASNGSVIGAWNSSNAESLLRYTVNKGYPIYGWELGNELSGNGIGATISADQYASDISHLQNLVQVIYKSFQVKPIVMAPGGFLDANWYTEFVHKAPNSSLQAVSQHIYSLGPGNDPNLEEKILDPSYLDNALQTFSSLQNILKSSGTSAVAWVSEAGGAWNSGHNKVTNAFVFSFWYLDQLGMASTHDTKTYCRQTLIGGNYGLLDTTTFLPNPDYYSALLWHRLMGAKVLSTSFSGTKKIRAYAHCSKASQGITLLLMNLDGNSTIHIQVSTGNSSSNGSLSMQQQNQGRNNKLYKVFREEYHLTAKDGDLHSQTMLLNGLVLSVDSRKAIPPLKPVYENQSTPVQVGPYSIVFVHIPNVNVPACK